MFRSKLLIGVGLLVVRWPAQGWWENGHRTTARLAAYYLTPNAQARLAAILDVPNDPVSVADGLAQASTWPDEIRKDRPETANWHFIDLALQDSKNNIPERCPNQNCVTARIDLFSRELASDKAMADQASDLDSLRFLVHFVGDLHQPLHAASDADLGGNCEPLDPMYNTAKNLHALWDGPLVDALNPDDRQLSADLKSDLDKLGEERRQTIAQGSTDDWAWESHRIALKLIYKRLRIPTEPVEFPASCKLAPEAIVDDKIAVEANYVSDMKPIIRQQLERGGLRLARILNHIYESEVDHAPE